MTRHHAGRTRNLRLPRGWLAAAFLLAHGTAAAASEPAANSSADVGSGSHERHVASVAAAGRLESERILARYDEHLRQHPDDVVAAVERCRFVEALAYTETAFASASSAECIDALRASPRASEPPIQVFLLEQTWGADGIAAGEELVTAAGSWPRDVRAQLHGRLAVLYQGMNDEARAGQHALRAIDLNPGAPVLMMAAQWLERRGAKERARSLVTSAPANTWDRIPIAAAASLLARVGDPQGAIRLLATRPREDVDVYADLTLARAFVAANQVSAARDLYASALAHEDGADDVTAIRGAFELERDHGTPEQQQAAYARFRAYGYEADPFARYRLDLLVASPFAGWTATDGLGLLALAASFVFAALLPLVVTAPVHYCSLARRLRGAALASTGLPWGLGHAWYALAVLMVAGWLGLYLFAYPDFEALFELAPYASELSDDRALGRAMVVAALLSGLLLLPLQRGIGWGRFLGGRWPLRKSLTAATVMVLLVRIVAVLGSALFTAGAAALGSDTTRALQGIYAEYGFAALLLMAAVVVPMVEELVFRGVLLNALARHVPFAWAAVVQAAAFALAHEELPNLPWLFLFGLTAAWLYRRSQGLVAPILFHAFHNALACVAIVLAARLDALPG